MIYFFFLNFIIFIIFLKVNEIKHLIDLLKVKSYDYLSILEDLNIRFDNGLIFELRKHY